MSERFQRHSRLGCETSGAAAEHRECRHDDRLGPRIPQRSQGSANGGTCVDHVIHDGHPSALHRGPESHWQDVIHREQSIGLRLAVRFRVCEWHLQRRSHDQCDKGVLHQRATNRLDGVFRNRAGQLIGQRSGAGWMEKQQLQVQPRITMMPGLQPKMPPPRRKQALHLRHSLMALLAHIPCSLRACRIIERRSR